MTAEEAASMGDRRDAANEIGRLAPAVLGAALRQLATTPGTEEHKMAGHYLGQVSQQLVDTPGMSPMDAVSGQATMDAILLRDLCARLGIDPLSLVDGYEQDLAFGPLIE